MKWISFFFLTSAMFMTSAFSVYNPRIVNGKVIYGDDNRLDVYEVEDSSVRKIASSTAAMFQRYSLQKQENFYRVISGTLAKDYKVCSDEPFANQPAGAICSAFLVGEDLVATAGHCISSNNCSTKAFAFGYSMKSAEEAPMTLPEEDVYFCKQVIKSEVTHNEDYALVQLDRPVKGRDPLKLSSRVPEINSELVVIGHPTGIPTKVAGGAAVMSHKTGYFVANLDTFGGNSGSAVFNAETLEVEGILVRGETDYKFDSQNKCYRSNVCDSKICGGEEVTNIGFVSKLLNTTYLD